MLTARLFPEQLGIQPDECEASIVDLQHGECDGCPVPQFGPNEPPSLCLLQDFNGPRKKAEGLPLTVVNFHREFNVRKPLAIDDQNAFSGHGRHLWATRSRRIRFLPQRPVEQIFPGLNKATLMLRAIFNRMLPAGRLAVV
jgi:hypothetical protein